MSDSVFKVEVQRMVGGNLRLTVMVEQLGTPDTAGRPLPPLLSNRHTPSSMTWTDIGRRANVIAHEFANEMTGNAATSAVCLMGDEGTTIAPYIDHDPGCPWAVLRRPDAD